MSGRLFVLIEETVLNVICRFMYGSVVAVAGLVVVMVLLAVLLLVVALLFVDVLGFGLRFAHDYEPVIFQLLYLLSSELAGFFLLTRAAVFFLSSFFELGLVLASLSFPFSVVASVTAFASVGSVSVVLGLVLSLSSLLVFRRLLSICCSGFLDGSSF